MNRWMIYGANGYTGELIAREAKRRGLSPILAGRNALACQSLADELKFEARVFACETSDQITKNLHGVNLVLHCAGPFSATSSPMLEACLKTKAHYLDITGEIFVFERIHAQTERLRQGGIVAMPGVGFDVVPSDCLAALLKEKLPNATHLALAFQATGQVSPGTTKTMIEGLGQAGAIRKDGVIKRVPTAYHVREICFDKKPRSAVTIPWGDVATAYYSTGIPNIQVYLASSPRSIRIMKLSEPLQKLLAFKPMQKILKKVSERMVKGPDLVARTTLHCMMWGEASTEDGRVAELRLRLPEPYALTVETALAAVERVLRGDVAPGAWTPSMAFGGKFILGFKGVECF